MTADLPAWGAAIITVSLSSLLVVAGRVWLASGWAGLVELMGWRRHG